MVHEIVMSVDASSSGQHVLSHDASKLKLRLEWTVRILILPIKIFISILS